MCQAVSLILKSDGTVILPDPNEWNHSHSAIFERMGIKEGAITDCHARIEVVPNSLGPDCYRSDPTDEKLWKFVLDEQRVPAWFGEDRAAYEDKCRREVARWMKKVKPGVAHYDVVTSGYGGTSTSGDRGTSTSGDYGISTSGHCGTSTSGYRGTSTSGNRGTSTSGDHGTSTSGDYGISTSGEGGTSISGDYGTSTSGYHGTSTSGHCGTSTSGNDGISISGDGGTSTSGYGGTAKSGVDGILQIKWYDGIQYRIATAYVGENGIEPDVAYKVNNFGSFIKKIITKATS